jgi:hypothetical protein
VRRAAEWHQVEIAESLGCTARAHATCAHRASPHRRHLEVDQLRRSEPLACEARAGAISIGAVVAKCGRQHRRVDDDHRAARTPRAASARGTLPPVRSPARASSSSTVG